MKILKKENSIILNKENIKSKEYRINDSDINIAIIEVIKRYPKKDFALNKVCKELVYIEKGGGTLSIKDDQEYSVCAGGVVLIEPKELYFWTGNFKFIISCTPAWYPEQHKNIN